MRTPFSEIELADAAVELEAAVEQMNPFLARLDGVIAILHKNDSELPDDTPAEFRIQIDDLFAAYSAAARTFKRHAPKYPQLQNDFILATGLEFRFTSAEGLRSFFAETIALLKQTAAILKKMAGTTETNDSTPSRYHFGDVHMGHKINVVGPAIINIDTVLSQVTQAIDAAAGLSSAQKSDLDALVTSLKADLDKLKASHAEEVKAIADALDKAVANAAKSPQERKESLLRLSAKGLKDAAELVKDIAPTILDTADLVAKFIVGL